MRQPRTPIAACLVVALTMLIAACGAEDPPSYTQDPGLYPPDMGSDPGWPDLGSGIAWPDLGGGSARADAGAPPPPPPAAPTCSAGAILAGTRWVKKGAGSAQLRSQPSASSASLATVPVGKEHPLSYYPEADKSPFACVSYNGTYGYIDAMQLHAGPPAEDTGCHAGLPSKGQRWVKGGTLGLNLRSEPSSAGGDNTVIAVIPEDKSEPVEYLADSGTVGWVCVSWKGKVGYVSASYLSTQAPPDPPPPSNSGNNGGSGWAGWGSGNCETNYSHFFKCTAALLITKPCSWRWTEKDCNKKHWLAGNTTGVQCCTWRWKQK